MLNFAGLNYDCHRVPNHRPNLRHEISGGLQVKRVGSRVVSGDLLPAVVEGRRIPALELKKLGVRKDCVVGHGPKVAEGGAWRNGATPRL